MFEISPALNNMIHFADYVSLVLVSLKTVMYWYH